MTATRRRPAALVAGYLLWVSLAFVVEGAARRHCHVPSKTWVEAGASAHERALRGFTYDKAVECLDATNWYSYSMALMVLSAVLAPFVVIGLFAKRILHAGLSFPVDDITAAAVLYSALFVLALVLSMGPLWTADVFFDRYGVGQ